MENSRTQGKNSVICGILHRHKSGYHWNSKAIDINNRFKNFCKDMECFYADLSFDFWENHMYYAGDGNNPSEQGIEVPSC